MAVFEEFTLLRDIALSFLVTSIAFSIEFSIYFMWEWLKKTRRTIYDLRFAWAFFLIGWAFNNVFYIMSDFYTSGETRLMWIRLGYLALLIGVTIFANIQERALPWNTHNFFGILGITGIGLAIFLPHDLAKVLLPFVYVPLFLFLFTSFSVIMIKKNSGILRLYSILFFAGFLLGIIAFELTSDISVAIFGTISYTVGTVLLVAGIMIMSFSITNLPSFGELDWHKKIREIFLVYKDGTVLVHVTRRRKEDKGSKAVSSESTSRAISGINKLLSEVTRSEKTIKAIDYGDVKLLFGSVSNADLVVVAEEDLEAIRDRIDQFMNAFSNAYKDILDQGLIEDREVFKPAETMIRRIFEI